jgi:hypothetical protein
MVTLCLLLQNLCVLSVFAVRKKIEFDTKFTICLKEVMVTRSVVVLLIVTLMLFAGGCSKGEDTGVDAPDSDNALEEYSSTLLNSLDKSKRAGIQASLPTIRLRIEQYKMQKGRYPESLEEITMPDIPLQFLSYNPETGEVGLHE